MIHFMKLLTNLYRWRYSNKKTFFIHMKKPWTRLWISCWMNSAVLDLFHGNFSLTQCQCPACLVCHIIFQCYILYLWTGKPFIWMYNISSHTYCFWTQKIFLLCPLLSLLMCMQTTKRMRKPAFVIPYKMLGSVAILDRLYTLKWL